MLRYPIGAMANRLRLWLNSSSGLQDNPVLELQKKRSWFRGEDLPRMTLNFGGKPMVSGRRYLVVDCAKCGQKAAFADVPASVTVPAQPLSGDALLVKCMQCGHSAEYAASSAHAYQAP